MDHSNNPYYQDLLKMIDNDVTNDYIIFKSHLPFLKLDIPTVPVNEIYEELKGIKNIFTVPTPQFDHSDRLITDFPEVETCSLDNNKKCKGGDIYNLYTYDINPRSDTSDKTPFTTNFINTFLGNNIIYHRAQVNLLCPGGWIAPHVDNAAPEVLKYRMGGKPGQLCTLNIAITQPEGSRVTVENCGNVPFQKPGDAYLIDVTRVHGVFNTNEDRYHLILRFDWLNSNLHDKDILKRSYFKMLGNYN